MLSSHKLLFKLLLPPCVLFLVSFCPAPYQIARLKYNGGGDWYVSPTALPNLIRFCNKNIGTTIQEEEATVEASDKELFNYPLLYMSGHGNVIFSTQEASNLRTYLTGGGFLLINDSYGLKQFAEKEMKKVFPELTLVELPTNHPLYHQAFEFPNGLPKIHEHDGKAPQGLGIIYNGRLVCYLCIESDIGDGWEDPEIHNDSEEKRTQALQMGANLLQYIFMETNR
jgi:hypothetical protein